LRLMKLLWERGDSAVSDLVAQCRMVRRWLTRRC